MPRPTKLSPDQLNKIQLIIIRNNNLPPRKRTSHEDVGKMFGVSADTIDRIKRAMPTPNQANTAAVLQLRKRGKTNAEISKNLAIPLREVSSHVNKSNVERPRKPTESDFTRVTLEQAAKEKYSDAYGNEQDMPSGRKVSTGSFHTMHSELTSHFTPMPRENFPKEERTAAKCRFCEHRAPNFEALGKHVERKHLTESKKMQEILNTDYRAPGSQKVPPAIQAHFDMEMARAAREGRHTGKGAPVTPVSHTEEDAAKRLANRVDPANRFVDKSKIGYSQTSWHYPTKNLTQDETRKLIKELKERRLGK